MYEHSANLSSLQIRIIELLSRAGIIALARQLLVREGRFALAFHGVSSQRYRDIPRDVQPYLTVLEFRQVMQWIGDRFAFLTPEEFFDGSRRGVLLTFDDGLASNYNHVLPLLQEFKAPAIFFVSLQHVLNSRNWLPASRKYALSHWKRLEDVPDAQATEFYDGMNEQQLISVAQHPLITIGSHTVGHPRLPQCSNEELEYELNESKRILEERIGYPVDLFAYPYAAYDLRVAKAVHAAGYKAAFAFDPIPVGLPNYEIPRIDLYWADPGYLDVKLSGLFYHPIKASLKLGN